MRSKRSESAEYYFLKRLKYYFEIGDFQAIILLLDTEMIQIAGTDVWYYLLLMLRANSRELTLQPVTQSSVDVRFFICLATEKVLVKLSLDQKHSVSAITIFVSEPQLQYINRKLKGNQLVESGILYVPPSIIQMNKTNYKLLKRSR
ncbi:MAG TPA: hypothetical protein VK151_11270 [Fluviicola sp.]|nr:hypothetical protein [Fluviicola sp.]